ncbi:TonB-dependent receptor [Sphingomonas sp. RIT328]|uniref:TonB-dependent receptor n=1 Tax=Sphingomonas sp. RIT328 TaxID=1470591 RepID=UPI00044D3EFD|nr:TonB-dependent receptor [Sphingomonas sp. RIT328]EZP50025.1 TonB-dependent outer membrane siderophore receptor [Sphingomonas sp. RIT328]
MRWGASYAAVALVLGGVEQASAQTVARYQFDIPASVRAAAIQAVAHAAGADVSFAEPGDASLHEPIKAIRGKLTLAQALRQALAGSDWYVETAGNGQIRIARRGGNSSDIIVTGVRDAIRKEDSNLLTRSDTPLKDTPGTIVSVTQEVLASQNTTSVSEALRNLPGVTYTPGPPSQVGSRGDTTQGASFTSGLRNSAVGGDAPTIDVESIEVLKGPSSVLTGTAVAGGLVNFNPKRALGISDQQFDIGGGSNRYTRGSVDVGGAISEEDRLYWRLVGLAEHADRQNNGGRSPHSYVAGAIFAYRDHGWKIDASSQFYDTRIVYGKLFYDDLATNTVKPVTAFSNENDYYRVKSLAQNLSVERDLASSDHFTLRLRSRLRYQYAEQTLQNLLYQGKNNIGLPQLQDTISGNASFSKNKQFSSSTDIYAKLATGPVTQQIIVAFDYAWQNADQLARSTNTFVPLQPAPVLATLPDSTTFGRNTLLASRKDYGVVVQDQIAWGPLHALLSLRQTWFDLDSRQQFIFTPTIINNNGEQRISKLLPTGGLVLSATDWASIYYTYQKAITPPRLNVLVAAGVPFPPSISTGHEAGVKLELFDGRMSLTADYFRKSSNNQPFFNPANPAFSLIGPGQKSEGFEINQSGKITPTLFLQSGFAYATSRIDVPLISAPKYQANAWLLKSFKVGDGEIDVGAGGNYQKGVNLVLTNFTTGVTTYPAFPQDYLRFDAAIGYKTGPLKLNLTVNNLFDRFNILTPLVANNLYQGVGREFRLVLTTALPRSRR